MTANFDYYRLANEDPAEAVTQNKGGLDPSVDFLYKTVPHITFSSISTNENLDPIFSKYEPLLDNLLSDLNQSLAEVDEQLREKLVTKLAEKMQEEGVRAATDADNRRWLLPGTTKTHIESVFGGKSKLKPRHVRNSAKQVPPGNKFEHWHVPFDTDQDWPDGISSAVLEYRRVWREKIDAVNENIRANAHQEELVDQPEIVKNVVRVSGPFTVEGTNPREFSDIYTDNVDNETQNLNAYLKRMTDHFRQDGLTFLNKGELKFSTLDGVYDGSNSIIHAEATLETAGEDGPATVAISFGPEHGPVTSSQVEDFLKAAEAASCDYKTLILAGFSFEPEATASIQEASENKLQIHMAHIRPDLMEEMDKLLKDTANSQLFTVFGLPAIKLEKNSDDEYICLLEGVDIYDPVRNKTESTGAEKVAAWFLDSDYNNKTFCITQAFFPDQGNWDKLAKSLRGIIDEAAFTAFKGTKSLPFKPGENNRIAVKVIDPRGNEVMTIHEFGE